MLDRFTSLAKNTSIRAVGVLVGGTSLSQAIIAITLPLATRLYTPDDFALAALFTSVVSIISTGACLRFDIAVPLPETDREAIDVLVLALGSATIASLTTLALVLAMPSVLTEMFNRPALGPNLWMIPVGVLAASYYSTLQYWFVRKHAFGTIAINRIVQSIAASASIVSLAHSAWRHSGCSSASRSTSVRDRSAWRYSSGVATGLCFVSSVFAHSKLLSQTCYIRFPKFSTLEARVQQRLNLSSRHPSFWAPGAGCRLCHARYASHAGTNEFDRKRNCSNSCRKRRK